MWRMTLQHFVEFVTARETIDGKGWHYSYWDDAQLPAPVVTEEFFYRLQAPGAPSSAKTITNRALTTNVVTITTSAAHGFVVGDYVTVALTTPDPIFDGTYIVASTPTTTTFTYAKTNANVTTAAAAGTATSQPSVFERMRAIASADPIMRAYFLDRAETSVLTANSGTVTSTRDASITAEGLVP